MMTTHGEDEVPDRTLVAAAQAGDGTAFLRLVARYRTRLEAALRDVGNPARARRWLRRRLRPRRFAVLLVVLPLKGHLVRHLFRTPQTWEARLSAVVSLVAPTVATLRFVFARPSWPARPAPVPTMRGADAHGNGDRGAERGCR